MLSSIHQINNEATQCLRSSQLKSAMQKFTSALTVLRDFVPDDEHLAVKTSCSASEGEVCLYLAPSERLIGSDDTSAGASFSLFDCLYLIDDLSRPCYASVATEIKVEVASAALFYNMALTYHLQYVYTGECGSLDKAGKLYDYAVSVASPETVMAAPTTLKLLIAANNNRGNVRVQLSDHKGVQECRRQAKTLIHHLGVGATLTEAEMELVFFNVLPETDV